MKKFIFKTHQTEMIIDEEGNRQININYHSLGCQLPNISNPREMEMGNCKIRQVKEDA